MGPVRFSGSAREGPERCVLRSKDFQGGPRESGTGPRGPFLGGPGSAKVRQGSNFDGKSWRILRFLFFDLNDFWQAPRGSQERGAEQQEFQRGAQGGAPSSLWGPEGRRGGPSSRTGGGPAERGATILLAAGKSWISSVSMTSEMGGFWVDSGNHYAAAARASPAASPAECGRPGETDKEGFYLMTPVPGGYGGFNRSAHSAGPVHFCGLFVFVIRGRVVDEWWPIQLVQSSHISGMVEHAGQSSRLL